MQRVPASELTQRLRAASSDELKDLLRARAGEIGAAEAGLALRNPFADRALIEWLASEKAELFTGYAIRRAVAFHARSPETLALRLVQGLYWGDLVRLAADTSVRPVVRRGAELRLLERLPMLGLGERVALARQASVALVAAIRQDPNPLVIAALLENPRLTEALLLPLASSVVAAPAVLSLLARNPRWGVRAPMRAALARNPRLPGPDACALLPGLARAELQSLASDLRLSASVRQRARLLAGI